MVRGIDSAFHNLSLVIGPVGRHLVGVAFVMAKYPLPPALCLPAGSRVLTRISRACEPSPSTAVPPRAEWIPAAGVPP
jgi:hypothetical protein